MNANMDPEPSVLLVDDNISLFEVISMILARKGYMVVTASDGATAIERVKKQAFDIVFMDVRMPEMDGVEACKRIRQIRPGVGVVMMTAYAVPDLVDRAMAEGADGVMYKPLDIDKMVALIEQAHGRTLCR